MHVKSCSQFTTSRVLKKLNDSRATARLFFRCPATWLTFQWFLTFFLFVFFWLKNTWKQGVQWFYAQGWACGGLRGGYFRIRTCKTNPNRSTLRERDLSVWLSWRERHKRRLSENNKRFHTVKSYRLMSGWNKRAVFLLFNLYQSVW